MENIDQPITELYPAHTSALQNARILPNKILSVKELQEEEILRKQQALANVDKDSNIPKETLPVITKSKYGLLRIYEHFSDVSALTMTNKERQKRLDTKEEPIRSDAFAKHFQRHFPKDATPQQLRHNLELKILWEGNVLTCVKNFQT
eukprot:5690529-Ditylum_brightwellii.AAC.1